MELDKAKMDLAMECFDEAGKKKDSFHFVGRCYHLLMDAGFKPEDIETEEHRQIWDFVQQGYKKKAQKWLDKTRENADKRDVKSEIDFFVKCLKKVGLKPKDIDTNMTEILDLLNQGIASSIQFWFDKGRLSEDENQIKLCQKYFRIYNRNLNIARRIESVGRGWKVRIDRRFVDL